MTWVRNGVSPQPRNIMFKRFILNTKLRTNVTLRAWSCRCESIISQRARRIQHLFTFYKRIYGPHGKPPLRGIMLCAASAIGLSINKEGFDWKQERLSLRNFDLCHRDIEFINQIKTNKRCVLCEQKKMKYCFCQVGNKKCKPHSGESGRRLIRNCCRPMQLQECSAGEMGKVLIESAEENPWEPYFSKNEFTIWRREERTAMYSYKVYASFDDITAADLLQVQTDINYRRQWDETAVTLEMIEEDPRPGTNSHIIYWELQWPSLFSNRDYVYCRRFVTDSKQKVMMICNRGTRHRNYRKRAGKVRITDYWSLMVIKPFRNFDEPGVHYMLTYYDDPGLPIPQSLKSWVTQKRIPEFLKKMYQATKEYAYKRAHELNRKHPLSELNITNVENTANVECQSWLRRLWGQREGSKCT